MRTPASGEALRRCGWSRARASGGSRGSTSRISETRLLLELLLGHLGRRVDAHLPEAPFTRVDELVRRAGRDHEDRSGLRLDRLAVDRERGRALLEDERLLVGVAVKARALSRCVMADEEGDGRAVLAALKSAGSLAARQFVEWQPARHLA